MEKKLLKKIQARKIWEACFQDSSEENDFYFNTIFQEENWKTYEEKQEILSSLHETFYPLRIKDKSYLYPYIIGVATLPQHRGKSYMTKLLFQEFTALQKEGIDFCFLTPIHPMIYRSFGFEYFSGLEEYHFPTSMLEKFPRREDLEIIEITKENSEDSFASLEKIYSIASLSYFSFLEKKQTDFKRLFQEILLSQGHAYLFLQHGRPSAYIFFYQEKEQLIVRECFATNPQGYKDIFFFLKSFREYFPKIVFQVAENLHLEFFLENQKLVEKKFSPFMMGRILSPKSFLEKFEFSAPNICIFIEDPVLMNNTGFYTLDEKITFSQEKIQDYDFSIGIRELVPLCFGFFSFRDLLQLGKIKLHSIENLTTLEKIFSKKFNFFHEYW